MTILEINNCKKIFNNNVVLHDISLKVDEGEVVAIIGSSGSGKSTLLRCATLLETMDGGDLSYIGKYAAKTVNDKVVYADKNELINIKNNFGLVFQNFNLFPHWTVLKNIIDAPISVKKWDKDEVIAHAKELLIKVGLTDKENFYPYQLSGGQQQRVAIARALALKPKILFFDEPTSALDPELTGEILKVIKDLSRDKMTMVIVTHEMSFARDVAERVIFMDEGYVVEEGLSKDVIDNPKEERTKQFLKRFTEYK